MIFACAAQAAAQNGVASVYGTVLAYDGTPISGANVTITSSKRSQRTLSGADGRFEFSNVPPGTYQVSASAAGYTPLANSTTTIGTQPESLTLTLVRATTNSLTVIDSVRVGAGETVSTSSAPSVALSAQGAAASGVTQISDMLWNQLATTPVLPLGGGSNATAAFALRGPDPTETLVDIDGHQMNNGNTGDFDLSLIDPAAMQDVQLVYGISPSSLAGPDTIGGAINILTLEPATTPQTLLRAFGGSFGSFGETIQSTGTKGLFGYAVSLHQANSSGSVNQTVLDSASNTYQHVGSGSLGDSLLSKLRYQLGGKNGYGYLQLDFRNQTIDKDESALLTTYSDGTFGSAAGTSLAARQANYGFDAQLPIGNAKTGDAPSTVLSFSHLTTVDAQSVSGPLADSLPYLYNQRDALGDDWIEIDHRWDSGDLSLKYDVATEALTTDYVQGQIVAQLAGDQQTPATEIFPLSQTQRYGVIRYNGDPTSHIHYLLATYFSNYSTFGTSIDPRAGFVWTPTGNTAVRVSAGTTFQTPQLSELVVPPPALQVPVGGIVYVGNPNLRPDHATEYDLGGEHIFGRRGRRLHLSLDVYRTNLRAPSSQINVTAVPGCGSGTPCPVSYPLNAGAGVYRGIQVQAEQELNPHLRVRAGWDVDSSYLTIIPPDIQDGTLVPYLQTLGQPLHKAYLGFERTATTGIAFGADVNYEGTYNELNRPPYATLQAHAVWNGPGMQVGLYGTNLTNTYSDPFTNVNAGTPFGNPAYVLQGRKVLLVVTRSL